MTEHDTTVLAERLHRLADEQAPQLDVVGQVRAARQGHRRQRRGRLAILAVATATTAVVVGTATAVTLWSADRTGEVARPSMTTSAQEPTPSAAPGPVLPGDGEIGPQPTVVALPDGEHFGIVEEFDPVTGQVTIAPADWLGEGRTWSCVPEAPGPYGTVDDVTQFCVGPPGPPRSLPVTATGFLVTGTPPHSVDAATFAAEVERLADDRVHGPLMGWFTVESGAVSEFQQTPRQSA